jgi:hypothetical protein
VRASNMHGGTDWSNLTGRSYLSAEENERSRGVTTTVTSCFLTTLIVIDDGFLDYLPRWWFATPETAASYHDVLGDAAAASSFAEYAPERTRRPERNMLSGLPPPSLASGRSSGATGGPSQSHSPALTSAMDSSRPRRTPLSSQSNPRLCR